LKILKKGWKIAKLKLFQVILQQMNRFLFIVLIAISHIGKAQIDFDTSDVNNIDEKGRKTGWWVEYSDSTLNSLSFN
jgi:hypothetical protein